MTTTSEPKTTEPATKQVGYGTAVIAPNGHQSVQPEKSLWDAIREAEAINRTLPGTAWVVYREEEHGEWTADNLATGQFAVCHVWPDRTEYEPARSREAAERDARLANATSRASKAHTVARPVTHGSWQPFAAAATPAGPSMSARVVQPPQTMPPIVWWLTGPWLWIGLALLLPTLVSAAEMVADSHPLVHAAVAFAGLAAVAWHVTRKAEQHSRT
ncbi:hypothetical protein C1I95_24640 [Micromonospora craterilacus]|uniref:Uncharacterized protein n=1 Tax=Micromonospora craterilacus TaxID=1655439 RepID=A0A2W2EKW1_9ACTN|nr:hypothetical protein [Micromonospora craterilacus]PZG12998.1 hypothetical protein C1I95_24640 [Micromonospora craterilacus]